MIKVIISKLRNRVRTIITSCLLVSLPLPEHPLINYYRRECDIYSSSVWGVVDLFITSSLRVSDIWLRIVLQETDANHWCNSATVHPSLFPVVCAINSCLEGKVLGKAVEAPAASQTWASFEGMRSLYDFSIFLDLSSRT